MVRSMRKEKDMDKESLFMILVEFTKDGGFMTKDQVKALRCFKMEISMREII